MSHVKFDGITPQEVIESLLWDKFARETRIFGKNISYFETGPKELQCETMEWYFSKLWHEIQDLSIEDGRGWKSAMTFYFEKLCQRNSLTDAAIGSRRKYLGVDKWKESVGLIERQAEP